MRNKKGEIVKRRNELKIRGEKIGTGRAGEEEKQNTNQSIQITT